MSKGIKCQQAMEALERIAPKRLAEEWDNPGLLAGRRNREVHRVFIALDATEETIR